MESQDVVVVAMLILGILGCAVLFMNTDNQTIPIIVAGLITLSGLVYGVTLKNAKAPSSQN